MNKQKELWRKDVAGQLDAQANNIKEFLRYKMNDYILDKTRDKNREKPPNPYEDGLVRNQTIY